MTELRKAITSAYEFKIDEWTFNNTVRSKKCPTTGTWSVYHNNKEVLRGLKEHEVPIRLQHVADHFKATVAEDAFTGIQPGKNASNMQTSPETDDNNPQFKPKKLNVKKTDPLDSNQDVVLEGDVIRNVAFGSKEREAPEQHEVIPVEFNKKEPITHNLKRVNLQTYEEIHHHDPKTKKDTLVHDKIISNELMNMYEGSPDDHAMFNYLRNEYHPDLHPDMNYTPTAATSWREHREGLAHNEFNVVGYHEHKREGSEITHRFVHYIRPTWHYRGRDD